MDIIVFEPFYFLNTPQELAPAQKMGLKKKRKLVSSIYNIIIIYI